MSTLDVAQIRKDFPILDQQVNGKKLVFLDSAASSQRPRQVIDAMSSFYEQDYANVHRGVYSLAERSTAKYEQGRASAARLLNANSVKEIVFTKNATEAINLVAKSWGEQNLSEGDVVVLSMLEHHANIVPWQMLAETKGIVIRWIPITADARLDLTDIDSILKDAKLLALTAMSNVTGTITPLQEIIKKAKAVGCKTLVDACQSVPHSVTDVQQMGADFLVFSAHKMLGPSGLGILWAKQELLEEMPPFLGGGGMINNVTVDGFTTAEVPAKFEAGTPPITEVVGLNSAIEYLEEIGLEKIAKHETEISQYLLDTLPGKVGEGLTIFGPAETKDRGAVFSFELEGVHAHDISQILNEHGVCIRPGHHCAKPLMKVFGTNATARASFYLYNNTDEVDALADALIEAKNFFSIG